MNPNMYLHEIIRTVPGREEPYMASVASLHHDPTRDHRMDSGAVQQFRIDLQLQLFPQRQ